MDVQLFWVLTMHEFEDRNVDDPRLQFAYLTTRGGTPIVIGHATELLFNSPGVFVGHPTEPDGSPVPINLSGSQTLPLPPTEDDPYLGFAVRAIDEDNSKSSDRDGDFGRYLQSIEAAAQGVIGGELNGDDLWTAANAPGLRNRPFRDDDDKIGVSVRVYPEFGARAARSAAGVAPGAIIEAAVENTTLQFHGDGAHWSLFISVRPLA